MNCLILNLCLGRASVATVVPGAAAHDAHGIAAVCRWRIQTFQVAWKFHPEFTTLARTLKEAFAVVPFPQGGRDGHDAKEDSRPKARSPAKQK